VLTLAEHLLDQEHEHDDDELDHAQLTTSFGTSADYTQIMGLSIGFELEAETKTIIEVHFDFIEIKAGAGSVFVIVQQADTTSGVTQPTGPYIILGSAVTVPGAAGLNLFTRCTFRRRLMLPAGWHVYRTKFRPQALGNFVVAWGQDQPDMNGGFACSLSARRC
jgi:hypothetical protein